MGDTLFHVLYGYYPSFEDGVLSCVVNDEKLSDTRFIQSVVRKRILKEHQQWKERYDAAHSKPVKYKVGEVVFIRRPPEHTGESTKLQNKFRGPLVVMEALPNNAYTVAAVRTSDERQYATTVNVALLRSFHLPELENDEMTGSTGQRSQSDLTRIADQDSQLESTKGLDREDNDEIEDMNDVGDKVEGTRKSQRQPNRPKWQEDYVL